MSEPLLIYNGTTYRLSPAVADDLCIRGVIVVDASSGADYALASEHLIEEVEPLATAVERADAPEPRRLGNLRVRAFSLFPGGASDPRNLLPPTVNRLGPDEDDRRDR